MMNLTLAHTDTAMMTAVALVALTVGVMVGLQIVGLRWVSRRERTQKED